MNEMTTNKQVFIINDQSISECFLNAIHWLDFRGVSSAASPDVLLGVVQHCSLLLASPGSDGDM